MTTTWVREDGYEVSDDPARIDADVVHRFLSTDAYWVASITPEIVGRMIAGALCLGVYGPDRVQVGFARVITDRVTRAWLCDLFILKPARGRGLGKWLVECILAHPELQGLRRWILSTSDAHELYRPFGFAEVTEPQRMMEYKPT
jgi:GNAT superfamily N-acetyltransferase